MNMYSNARGHDHGHSYSLLGFWNGELAGFTGSITAGR